jgi:hypothetical protein
MRCSDVYTPLARLNQQRQHGIELFLTFFYIIEHPVSRYPAQPSNPLNTPNAFVYSSAATFWIEWVRVPNQPKQPQGTDATLQSIEPFWSPETFLQLQYSQVSILVFNNVLWPHVNVATLTLSAG